MNPLTRTYVKRHRLDPEVFRRAAESYDAAFREPGDTYPGGCCHAIRRSCPAHPYLHRLHHQRFFNALLADDAHNGMLYMWPPPSESRGRDVHTMLTPRIIALELCALIVETFLT